MELDLMTELLDLTGIVVSLVSHSIIYGSRIMLTFSKAEYQLFILEGRQYGRGKTGGQVRDEYRTDYDPGRGGYGKRNEDASNRKRLA